MAGGRGLSVEEKRVKLLEIFHETKEFYTLKELEKLGSKKGVVSQTVKDVLQTLVDDNLVEFDKIGISNFYWSFPSARGAALKAKLEAARSELKSLEDREGELQKAIAASRADRVETEFRAPQMAEWHKLKNDLANAQTELAQFTNSVGSEAKARGAALAREAAFRWTENLSIAIQYTTSITPMTRDQVLQMANLDEDFEDLEG